MDDWDDALCWLLNGLGVLLSVWSVASPVPAVVIVCALVPWAALLVTFAQRRGPMGFWSGRREGPNVILAFMIPAVVIGKQGQAAGHILDPRPVFLMAAVVAVVWFAAFYALQYRRLPRDMIAVLFMMLVLGGVYGIGVVYLTDETADGSVTASYTSAVVGKRPAGKESAWALAPWGPEHRETTPDLGKLAGKVTTGDRVCIDMHPGHLGLEWYDIHRCPNG